MKKLPISLTIVFLVLGILLSTQFQSSKAAVLALAKQTPEDLAVMSKNLNDKKYDLLSEKVELRSQLRIFENENTKEEEIVTSMKNEINKLKVISGNLPASGPGIAITIFKSSDNVPLDFEELVAIINDLWHLKAEAISVNDIRIVGSTRISEVISTVDIAIDGQKLDYPIVINAIGDPKRLESDINVSGGYLFQLQTSPWNFKIEIDQKENLGISAVTASKSFNYAQPIIEK